MSKTDNKEPLAKLRKDAGFTIKALSQELGIDASTIIRWEKAAPRIPIKHLERVAGLLGAKKIDLRPDLLEDA